MEICRGCGAFIMAGWDRCKICGHDPNASLADPDPAAGAPARAKTRQPRQPRQPRDGGPLGTSLLFVVLLAAVAGAGYLFWYAPNHADDPDADAAAVEASASETAFDPAGDPGPVDPATGAPLATTTIAPPVDATTPPADATTPPAGPGARDQYAAAIATTGQNLYPDSDEAAWICAGGLVIDALGGAPVVAGQGVQPSDFVLRETESDLGQRLTVPAGAIDAVAAGLQGCGIDSAALLANTLMADTPDQQACIAAGLNRSLANGSVAGQLLVGAEALQRQTDFINHYLAVASGCGLGA